MSVKLLYRGCYSNDAGGRRVTVKLTSTFENQKDFDISSNNLNPLSKHLNKAFTSFVNLILFTACRGSGPQGSSSEASSPEKRLPAGPRVPGQLPEGLDLTSGSLAGEQNPKCGGSGGREG